MKSGPQVLITGHGQMGHAMESLLRGRAHLHIWNITPDRQLPPDEIRSAAPNVEYVLLCVPTVAHGPALDALNMLIPPQAAVLTIAKGLDDSGHTAADILESSFASLHPWAVLGGPMIANEIVAGRHAFAEFGSRNQTLFQKCVALFPSRLHLSYTPDPQAVSWCGVLKNIYAPLIGVADELGWGDNVRGHLIAESLKEMQGLLQWFTGRGASAYGDACLADFVTTVTSPSSHHYALGKRIARGDLGQTECEGVHSLEILQERGSSLTAGYPLFCVAIGLAVNPGKTAEALRLWLASAA